MTWDEKDQQIWELKCALCTLLDELDEEDREYGFSFSFQLGKSRTQGRKVLNHWK